MTFKITWYTKKGDGGKSKTLNTRGRILKSSLIFDALGNLDELNSWIGLTSASLEKSKVKSLKKELLEIQHDLFTIQAELAGSMKNLPKSRIIRLEEKISNYEERCPMPRGFVVSGATKEAALFDVVRTITRRAERSIVKIQEENNTTISPVIFAYINRLSSYCYVCARYLAVKKGKNEFQPKYR